MASPATSETDGRFAPHRSPNTTHYRGENFGSLADVWRAKKANEQGFAAETDSPATPTPELEPAQINFIATPPPDPEITQRWASVLGGGVRFVQHDGTIKDGPQTPGAAKRLTSLQITDS